ncbi:MAG: 2-hydroxyacid dehydrogenase [Bacteroidia bacterium]|nr:2-hydroxyacid dehydrogenase [Bacteroidia bacterium]
MEKEKKKVVIFGVDDMLTDDLFDYLRQLYHVTTYGAEAIASEDSFVQKAKMADVVCFFSGRISGQVLKQLDKTKLIVVCSTGYDYVDVETAAECGIAVCNSPSFSSRSVAEFQFMLLLALYRKLPSVIKENESHFEFSFSFNALMGQELFSKTIGIIGTGNNGTHACRIARGFGMEILAYSRTVNSQLVADLGIKYVSLDELLKRSDIISINIPLNDSTKHFLDHEHFSKMKNGVIIINTARGSVINEPALIEALKSGKVASAGLDVLENNTKDNPLLKMENVLVTPHMAWVTREALKRMVELMVENILGYFMGEAQNVVNKVYFNPISEKVEWVRPTLGNKVSIEVCQSLMDALYSGNQKPSEAGKILITKYKKNFSGGSVEEAVYQVTQFIKHTSLGLISPGKIHDKECRLTLKEGLIGHQQGNNTFLCGIISEIFKIVTGNIYFVTENECSDNKANRTFNIILSE